MSTTLDELLERSNAFARLELPGQPRFMHMGTSYLVDDLANAVRTLRAENAELRRDAARWQLARKWFRVMSPHIDGNHGWCPTGEWGRIKGPSIDAAIDAAMAGAKDD